MCDPDESDADGPEDPDRTPLYLPEPAPTADPPNPPDEGYGE